MQNLAAILVDTAARKPERTALSIGGTAVGYAALNEMSTRVAGLLAAQGVRPGDRVVTLLPDVPPIASIYYGALRYGAIPVLLNPLLGKDEISWHLQDTGARLVFAFEFEDMLAQAEAGAAASGGAEVVAVNAGSFRELLAATEPHTGVAPVQEEDPAAILYTAGTTDNPKGAVHSHGSLRRSAEAVSTLLALREEDAVFGGLPLFTGMGQTAVLNSAVLAGASVSLLPRFEAVQALQILQRDAVTVLQAVPAMFFALLADLPEVPELPALRLVLAGGGPLLPVLAEEFERRWGTAVLQEYGTAEAPAISLDLPAAAPVPAAAPDSAAPDDAPGSAGWPLPGMEVQVLDDDGAVLPVGAAGELAVRGPGTMLGYWNRTAAAADRFNGWIRTGDRARVDGGGRIRLWNRNLPAASDPEQRAV